MFYLSGLFNLTSLLMIEKFKDCRLLIAEATDYLKTKLRYHSCTVTKHNRTWRWMNEFMNAKGIQHYNQKVEKQILYHRFKHRTIKQLTPHEKEVYNSIKM